MIFYHRLGLVSSALFILQFFSIVLFTSTSLNLTSHDYLWFCCVRTSRDTPELQLCVLARLCGAIHCDWKPFPRGLTFGRGKPSAAAKSLQSYPTLCNPIDGSPPGSPVPGILQARTLEWVAISFSSAWKWKVKLKLLSCVRLFVTPWTAAYQAPLSMGFSRQVYWSGVPVPTPLAELISFLLLVAGVCLTVKSKAKTERTVGEIQWQWSLKKSIFFVVVVFPQDYSQDYTETEHMERHIVLLSELTA